MPNFKDLDTLLRNLPYFDDFDVVWQIVSGAMYFDKFLTLFKKIMYTFVKLNNSYLENRKSDWAEIWREYIILNLKGTFVSLKTG